LQLQNRLLHNVIQPLLQLAQRMGIGKGVGDAVAGTQYLRLAQTGFQCLQLQQFHPREQLAPQQSLDRCQLEGPQYLQLDDLIQGFNAQRQSRWEADLGFGMKALTEGQLQTGAAQQAFPRPGQIAVTYPAQITAFGKANAQSR